MKITSLKQQIKNPERVNIFVDDKYSFSLNLTELVNEKLKKDQELSEADVKRLKKVSEDGKLKAKTLNWLLLRPHSTREFRDYLKRKKADAELIEQWIAEFTDRKYLDDQAFARWFADNRARKNKSDRAIRSELFGKGINRETIDQVLSAGEDSEEERLRALIKKKSGASRYQNDPLKFRRYLAGQGFSYDLIKKFLG